MRASKRAVVRSPWAVALKAFGISGPDSEISAVARPSVQDEDEGELDYDEIRALVKRCIRRGWVRIPGEEGGRRIEDGEKTKTRRGNDECGMTKGETGNRRKGNSKTVRKTKSERKEGAV